MQYHAYFMFYLTDIIFYLAHSLSLNAKVSNLPFSEIGHSSPTFIHTFVGQNENLLQSPSSWHIYTNWFFPKSEYKHSDTRRAGPVEKEQGHPNWSCDKNMSNIEVETSLGHSLTPNSSEVK